MYTIHYASLSDSKKWAWWVIGVVLTTIAAYGAFIAFVGHGPATSSVFALLALSAFPRSSWRYFRGERLDERQREIASKAARFGFGALWVVFVIGIVTIGLVKGPLATLKAPVWILQEILYWAFTLVLGVQALTTLVLYRGGPRG